jgi:serine carboxypeptidase-like clade 2
LASKIIDYNSNPTDKNVPRINLAGLAIGNGCTDETECTDNAETFPMHRFDFIARNNLISQALYKKLQDNQVNCYG